jgi:hypothetical protein
VDRAVKLILDAEIRRATVRDLAALETWSGRVEFRDGAARAQAMGLHLCPRDCAIAAWDKAPIATAPWPD